MAMVDFNDLTQRTGSLAKLQRFVPGATDMTNTRIQEALARAEGDINARISARYGDGALPLKEPLPEPLHSWAVSLLFDYLVSDAEIRPARIDRDAEIARSGLKDLAKGDLSIPGLAVGATNQPVSGGLVDYNRSINLQFDASDETSPLMLKMPRL